MVRTLAGIGIALALVGSAHAQDPRIVVKLDGKSNRALHSEIYRAAQTVCARDTTFDPVDMACVEATYEHALQQLRAAPRIERAAYVQTSPSVR